MTICGKKGLCRLVKDLEIRSSQIRMDPKSKDKGPCKRREGKKMKRKISVKTEADIGVMYLQVESPNDYGQPPEVEMRHGTDSPSESPEKSNSADTLILAPGLQSCESIHFCCFKPPCYW